MSNKLEFMSAQKEQSVLVTIVSSLINSTDDILEFRYVENSGCGHFEFENLENTDKLRKFINIFKGPEIKDIKEEILENVREEFDSLYDREYECCDAIDDYFNVLKKMRPKIDDCVLSETVKHNFIHMAMIHIRKEFENLLKDK